MTDSPAPVLRPARRSGDGGRASIVATARLLFSRNGFHGTGMAELAERAQVSVGQIYRLFSNKSDIISAIIAEDMRLRLGDMQALADRFERDELAAQDAFEQLVLLSIEVEEDTALTFEILAEGLRNPAVGSMIGDLCQDFRRAIRRMICKANPETGGDRLDAAEEMLLAALFGLDNRSLSRPRLTTAEIARHAAAFFLKALA